jgi:mannose-6-phosphate isomerase-like protein (cupin superfamily)
MYSLEWLLHPIKPQAFFEEFFERAPLLVQRRDPARYSKLLSVDVIDRHLSTTSPVAGQFFLVDAARELKPEDYTRAQSVPPGLIDLPRVHELFRSGATISVSQLQEYNTELAALCEAVEKPFSHHFQTNIYLSPPNAQGFKTHYDNHDVFVLQISGSKLWTLYDTGIELPLQAQGFDPTKHVAGPPTREFTLYAGDMLYCPRGLYHSARATDETSLHITLGLIGKTWADVLVEALSEACLASPAFRRHLPVGYANEGFDPGPAAKVFASLVKEFVDRAKPAQVLEKFADDFVASRRPMIHGDLAGRALSDPIALHTRVSPRPNLLCRLGQVDDKITILFGSSEIALPAAVAEQVRYCIRGPAFRVEDLPGDLDDPGKITLVRRLVQEGLLIRANR